MPDERLFRELDGKYRILAQLGEGGTARVWLAVARGPSGFNKLVVLKTIRQELLNDGSVVKMFLDEARLAARLNHPNIVQTNEVFEQANHPVIVMEYLDGLPFSAVMERQRQGDALVLAMLLRVVSEALAGLDAAHKLSDYDGRQLEVVHRDVSPHNLFITFAGQVKVLDFGIAQLTSTHDVTETGEIKGKLRYMAPEQISGERVDRRADIYSMGVILWEIAMARRMWPTSMPSATILKRVLGHDLPATINSDAAIDSELRRIIEKSLAAVPAHRYSSALELQNELDDYITTLGGTIRNRDVGRALSKMFDDVRKERARTIETQLARTDPIAHDAVPPAPFPELTSFSNTRGATPVKRIERKLPTALLLTGIFIALTVFALGLIWPEKPTTSEQTVEVSSSPAVAVPVRVPRPVEVEAPIPPAAAPVVEPASAPKRAPARRPASHQAAMKVPEIVAAPAPPLDNCSPPYFFDDRGVKKYKPECL